VNIEIPDLTNLNLVQVISTLLFFAAIDTLAAYAVALINKTFTAAYALDFLRTHILKVGVPITLFALAGNGIPGLGIPPVPAASLVATGSLAVYAAVTLVSIKDTFADKAAPPTETTAVAPVTETV